MDSMNKKVTLIKINRTSGRTKIYFKFCFSPFLSFWRLIPHSWVYSFCASWFFIFILHSDAKFRIRCPEFEFYVRMRPIVKSIVRKDAWLRKFGQFLEPQLCLARIKMVSVLVFIIISRKLTGRNLTSSVMASWLKLLRLQASLFDPSWW